MLIYSTLAQSDPDQYYSHHVCTFLSAALNKCTYSISHALSSASAVPFVRHILSPSPSPSATAPVQLSSAPKGIQLNLQTAAHQHQYSSVQYVREESSCSGKTLSKVQEKCRKSNKVIKRVTCG